MAEPAVNKINLSADYSKDVCVFDAVVKKTGTDLLVDPDFVSSFTNNPDANFLLTSKCVRCGGECSYGMANSENGITTSSNRPAQCQVRT